MGQQVTINNEEGLHARPAAVFVKEASSFTSDIEVKTDSSSANAKSLMSMMALGLTKGDIIEISASGSDAEKAETALVELVNRNFDL